MKILKVNLENFGKFKDFVMEFQEGMNSIYGENEFGKTTIMSFVYIMFYGKIPNEKGDIRNSIRKKYRPWNGLPMSGALEFEADGVRYNIHKELGKSVSTDIVQLTNLDHGEIIDLGGVEVGTKFLDLDAAAFEKSLFIGALGQVQGSIVEDNLSSRLSNLITTGDEQTSGSVVLERLTKTAEKLISKNKKRGSLLEARDKFQQMLQDKKENQELAKIIHQKQKEIDIHKDKIEELVNQKTILEKQKRFEELEKINRVIKEYNEKQQQILQTNYFGIYEKADNIIQEIKIVSDTLVVLNESIDDSLINMDEHEYNDLKEYQRQRDQGIKMKNYIQEVVLTAQKEYENSKKINQEKKREIQERKRKIGWLGILLVLSGIFIGIGFYITSTVIELIGTVLGVIVAVTMIVFITKNHDIVLENLEAYQEKYKIILKDLELKLHRDEIMDPMLEYQNVTNQIESVIQSMQSILDELMCKEEEIDKRYQASLLALEHHKNIKKQEQKRQELQKDFVELIAMPQSITTYSEAVLYYKKMQALHQEMMSLQNEKKIVLRNFGKNEQQILEEIGEVKTFLESVKKEDLRQIKEMDFDLEMREAYESIQKIERSIQRNPIDMEILEAQILEIEQELKTKEERYKILQIAAKYMKESVEEIGNSFAPELNEETGKIFHKLTKNKYHSILVDSNYEIKVRNEKGSFREWKYLSNGTIDQAYLSLRLALSKMLGMEKTKLPIFLDDVFVQYDKERKKIAMEYLEEISEENQVIYFTCH